MPRRFLTKILKGLALKKPVVERVRSDLYTLIDRVLTAEWAGQTDA